jgi:ABC-type lipoprotein release transport system permease subunit
MKPSLKKIIKASLVTATILILIGINVLIVFMMLMIGIYA